MKKSNIEEFIEKAKKIHGENYSYEKSVYVNNTTKIEIYCKKHQSYFWITPKNFLKGHGCLKCAIESRIEKQSIKQEDFIERCEKKFNGKKLDFSNSHYSGATKYVNVICHEKDTYGNEHGEFIIKASHLFNGHGCPKCANENNRKRFAKTLEEFKKESVNKFGDMFDFSLTKYVNNRRKVLVKCKKCGKIIETTPWVFLKGCGCQYCNGPLLELEINKLLSDNGIEYIYQYKNKKILGKKSLDFFIPSCNVGIECQGEQHFMPIEWWGGIDVLNKLKERDEIKYEACKTHGIKILYYSTSKKIPNEYFDKIYTLKEDLLNKIFEIMQTKDI